VYGGGLRGAFSSDMVGRVCCCRAVEIPKVLD
jgi:hypothetical protein